MRSESPYSKRVEKTDWNSARQEAEARTHLIEAEVDHVLAESRCIDAEGRRIEVERQGLEFRIFRKAVYFGIGLGISLVAFVYLLLNPTPPVDGGAGIVALLGWLAKRVGGSD